MNCVAPSAAFKTSSLTALTGNTACPLLSTKRNAAAAFQITTATCSATCLMIVGAAEIVTTTAIKIAKNALGRYVVRIQFARGRCFFCRGKCYARNEADNVACRVRREAAEAECAARKFSCEQQNIACKACGARQVATPYVQGNTAFVSAPHVPFSDSFIILELVKPFDEFTHVVFLLQSKRKETAKKRNEKDSELFWDFGKNGLPTPGRIQSISYSAGIFVYNKCYAIWDRYPPHSIPPPQILISRKTHQ